MTENESTTVSTEFERIIGRIDGSEKGPCLVFFGGIHGNEPSGVLALRKVLDELRSSSMPLKGSMICIAGNLWALKHGKRFHTADLNRVWTKERIAALEANNPDGDTEDEKQQRALYDLVRGILKDEKGPFYFFDLHTTSAATKPFITVNDSLLNRRFTRMYPVPLILGIEEYLSGPLLSYINELGYVSFGFEAGQHDAPESIENHKMFIYLSLVFSGVIQKPQMPIDQFTSSLSDRCGGDRAFYEIYENHKIHPEERFTMEPGYSNFQKLSQGELIARSDGNEIRPKQHTTLFMPLYQSQGDDGYFLIRKTPVFFLWLSALLRRTKIDRLFPWLPGVSWASAEREEMTVNLKVARLIARQVFHLFGYRSRQYGKTHLVVTSREFKSKHKDYAHEDWYRGRIG
ncbi:MAG: succinylglutamate desuccinylase/aspartoacylase family protein [Cyclobacteriaceae bacterium]